MSGFSMVKVAAGCLTTLLVEILLPCLLASVFNWINEINYSIVFFNSVQELSSACWKLQVLDSDVKSFRDDSVSDLLVDNNAQSSGVDVEDCSSSSVIVLVRHTLVDWTINDDVNDISDLVGSQVLWHSDNSVVSETLLEFVSGSSFISVTVGHLWTIIIYKY